MMMIQMNKPVVPEQVCLTSARVVPTPPNKAAAGSAGGWLRNRVNVVGKGTLLVAVPTPIPIQIQRRRRSCPLMATSHPNADIANNKMCPLIDENIKICPLIPSSGDPCLDLFSNSLRPWDIDTNHSLVYLKQTLPLAWSHNPLTTLKLIFSVESHLFSYRKFDTAVFWLLHNHPKTLLRNLHSIADLPWDWSLDRLVDILHNLLVYNRGGQEDEVEHAAANVHIHPERYDGDPGYRLLYDGVMDLFVDRLKSDINKMKQHKLKMKPSDYLTDGGLEIDEAEVDAGLLVSGAAECCTNTEEEYGAIFLNESIARRLFPLESNLTEEWERLRKEYLVPLTNYYNRQSNFKIRGDCAVKKYLEVKAGGGGNLMKPDALLPNEIIKYVEDEDVGEAAELQWKAMV